MSSRNAILSRIRKLLAGEPDTANCRRSPRSGRSRTRRWRRWSSGSPPNWRRLPARSSAATIEQAAQKLSAVVDELGAERIGRTDHPLCEELTAGLPGERFIIGQDDPDPKQLAELPAGLIAADTLLADTGSAMIACATPHHRLMCYLPPVCIVVAKTSQLVEHLPAAWEKIAARVADPGLRGEFVFVTGPSRTADIEKILILGVHGPKRLIVLLVG